MSAHLDRFFIPDVSRCDLAQADDDEARHIARVLRMKLGDELIAFDGTGVECRCRIAEVTNRNVAVEVLERREISREAPVQVTLAIAATKTKAMDLVVRKCTELGLARLMPFHSGRSVARIKDAAKSAKWRRATIEAAKQCGRNTLPEILRPADLNELADAIREHDLAVVAAVARSAATLREALRRNHVAKRIMYIIGPEGGFEADELAALEQAGAVAVSLGRSVLRVETAAIAALAMIVYEYSV